MGPSDLLRYVVDVLEGLHLEYLITGSTATIVYGEPRFTNDIVVRLRPELVAGVCGAFPPAEFYVSPDAAGEAVAQGGQFNIIHPASGLKIDIIVARDTPFDRSRFERTRRLRPMPDCVASFASIEDVIIKKMEYHREGGSDKHLRDIAGVLRVSGDEVDYGYISEWVSKLGLDDIWSALQQD